MDATYTIKVRICGVNRDELEVVGAVLVTHGVTGLDGHKGRTVEAQSCTVKAVETIEMDVSL